MNAHLTAGTSAAAPGTALIHSTSSSRFHSNPDILAEIFEYLTHSDDLDLDPDDVTECRQNLAWLALTCRAFLEPALDRLWRSLDTLFPLFKILPAFIQTDGTHVLRGPITQQDWERFDWYGRRVKKFCYTRDPENLDIAMHVYFRIAQLRSTPLLPSLRHLYCPDISQNDFLISGVCLFLTPSLQSLEFCKITSVEDKLSGTFLHTLLCDGAQLESIVFKGGGLSRGTLQLIQRFEHLRFLELEGMGLSVDIAWLKELGRKPKLEELALDFTNCSIEPLKEDVGFQCLKDLMITAPLSFTRAFLPHIAVPSLETLAAASSADNVVERNSFITEVVERWSRSLRSFALVHLGADDNTPLEDIQLSTIAPLLPLRNLHEFRIEGYGMGLTDENIKLLGASWPNLTKILLPYISPDRVRPTVASLRNLTELCPRLTHIRIPLDTSDIPSFIPTTVSSPASISLPSSTAVIPGLAAPTSETEAPPAAQTLAPQSPKQPHGLQKLTIATSDDTWEARDQVQLARHIDGLFPRLRYVTAFEGRDDERWSHVHDIVQAFQTVRTEALTAHRLRQP